METGSGEHTIVPCGGSPFQAFSKDWVVPQNHEIRKVKKIFEAPVSAGMRQKKNPREFFDLPK
jgi:hypothetical protein